MRCLACNKILNDFETTRKSSETKEYLDLCNNCYQGICSDVLAEERDDLRDNNEYQGE